MGDIAAFPAPRSRRQPPRAFEDPRWADRHSPAVPRAADAPGGPDCGCTDGHACRHNNACPRLARAGVAR